MIDARFFWACNAQHTDKTQPVRWLKIKPTPGRQPCTRQAKSDDSSPPGRYNGNRKQRKLKRLRQRQVRAPWLGSDRCIIPLKTCDVPRGLKWLRSPPARCPPCRTEGSIYAIRKPAFATPGKAVIITTRGREERRRNTSSVMAHFEPSSAIDMGAMTSQGTRFSTTHCNTLELAKQQQKSTVQAGSVKHKTNKTTRSFSQYPQLCRMFHRKQCHLHQEIYTVYCIRQVKNNPQQHAETRETTTKSYRKSRDLQVY